MARKPTVSLKLLLSTLATLFASVPAHAIADAAADAPSRDIGDYAVFAVTGDIVWYGATSMPASLAMGANQGAIRILDDTDASATEFYVAAPHVEVQGTSNVARVFSQTLNVGAQANVSAERTIQEFPLLGAADFPTIEEIECSGENVTVTGANSPVRLEPGRYDTVTVAMNQRIELVAGGHYELCRMLLNPASSILVHGDNTIVLRDFLATQARVRMDGAGACGARWFAAGVINSGMPNAAAFDFGDGNGPGNRALIAGQFLTPGRISMEQHNDYIGRFWAGDVMAGQENEVSRTLSACLAPQCGDGNLDPGEDCDDGNNREDDCCSALCSTTAVGSACNDGRFCTANDVCDAAGACRGSGDPCPGADGDADCSESCDEATSACDAPDPFATPCSTGLFCSGSGACEQGECIAASDSPCPGADGDENCSETCDEATRSCTAPDTIGSDCDDGAFCTTADTCRHGGVCAGDDITPCSDGDGDGDGNCNESCDEIADTCTAPDPQGAACNDGLFCTGHDVCNGAGECTGSGDSCASGDGDHDCSEACDEASRTCTAPDPNGVACEDGLACTIGDQCSLGTCLSGAELGCDDGDPCTDDFCDNTGGCTYVFNSVPCDDGNACTQIDTCQRGACVGTQPVDCEDGDLCSVDTCDPRDGSCWSAVIPDPTCNEDGDTRTRFTTPFNPTGLTQRASVKAVWRGTRNGLTTEREELADPTRGGRWALCVFDSDSGRVDLRYRLDLDRTGVDERAWRRRETRNKLVYKLRAPTGTPDGASSARMIIDKHNRAILKIAAGANVGCKPQCRNKFQPPLPVDDERLFALDPETLVQWKSSTGACWSSSYREARTNNPQEFNAVVHPRKSGASTTTKTKTMRSMRSTRTKRTTRTTTQGLD
ncbi:MAG: hypothetical protein ACI8TX_000384 [Hyphomicrobiaceae bacterium]|jgi:hypothetical protein